MKWFTYAAAPAKHRGYRRYRESPRGLALLFATDNGDKITEDDAKIILNTPEVKEIFGGAFFVFRESDEKLVVSNSPEFVQNPDKVSINVDPLLVYDGGQAHLLNLRQRYNNCRSLLKAVGCDKCPDLGPVCLNRELVQLPSEKRLQIGHLSDDDFPRAKYKHGKTQLAGFTYASPTMTKDGHFEPAYRPVSDHDFSQIDYWAGKRSEASSQAARNRAFKKNNCSICPMQKHCKRWERCDGPYPSEDEMIRRTLESWEERLKNLPVSEEFFWAVNYQAGTGSSKRYKRCNVALGEFRWDAHFGWRARLVRTKTSIGEVYATADEKILKEYFPSLNEVSKHAKRPEAPTLAIWLALQRYEHMRKARGWGNSGWLDAAWKSLEYDGSVRIQWGAGRYKYYYRSEISSFTDIHKKIDLQLSIP